MKPSVEVVVFNQEKHKLGEGILGWDEKGNHPEKHWVPALLMKYNFFYVTSSVVVKTT